MGIVYRAVHTVLNRPVALKQILAADEAELADALARFRREAEMLGAVAHSTLVQVYEAGEADGVPFIAMELIDGRGLDGILKQRTLPLRTLVELLRASAAGVAEAHARGIVHRDIKPGNILVETKTGRPRVLDFGLAVSARARDARLTRSGEIVGTAEYMAPEQLRSQSDEESITPRIDVYAFGVVLYEVLTGVLPFTGDNPLQALMRRTTEDPLAPHWLSPSVPVDLEAVCLKALERQPGRRYPECGAFAADLGRWLAGEPVSARVPSAWRRSWSWIRRNRRLVLGSAVAALLIAAISLAGRSAWRARRDSDRERRAQVQGAAGSLARHIDHRLAEGQGAAETLARVVEMFPNPAEHEPELKDFIRRTLGTHWYLYGACLAFAPDAFEPGRKRHMPYFHRSASDSGEIEFLYPDYDRYDYPTFDWYRRPAELQETGWTEAYYDENAGNVLMVTCSTPFYGDAATLHAGGPPSLEARRAHFRGVATVDVSLAHMHGQMDAIRVGERGYTLLVESSGRILTFPDRPAPFATAASVELVRRFEDLFPGEDLAGLLEDVETSGSGAVRETVCPNLGERAYFSVEVLRGTAWRLVTVCPVAELAGRRADAPPLVRLETDSRR